MYSIIHMQKYEWSTATGNNIDESHKKCWVKEASHKTIYFNVYKFQKQAKLINGCEKSGS